MNRKVLSVSFFVLLVATIARASIENVYVLPSNPIQTDVLSLLTEGTEGYGPVTITDTDLLVTGSSIDLDLFLEVGPYAVTTPWSHTEPIGLLPIGFYDVTVKMYEASELRDTYITSFEVVPEPASLALLAFGTMMYVSNKSQRASASCSDICKRAR
jgi:hypothetical protein